MYKPLTTYNFGTKLISSLKLKHLRNSIEKSKLLYWHYYRFGYFNRRFSGRRRMRLNRFFFFRVQKLHYYKKKKLRNNFFLFFNRHKLLYTANRFLTVRSLLLTRNFCHQFAFKKKNFYLSSYSRGFYSAFCIWLSFLVSTYIFPKNSLLLLNKLLVYRHFFLYKKRRRLQVSDDLICFKGLQPAFIKKKLLSFSRIKKSRRFLRSLFNRLNTIDLKKIFFITLRSSKNNTMLSIFDFFGNLLYWKTSKTVGMSGKKKGTKMAAEFLAYHLTRYLRSRRFYSYKFIFTLFGLHRHFKVVFRFIKKNIRSKNVIAMLARSKVPHGGCFIKKRKHKGRKKYRRRASLYY